MNGKRTYFKRLAGGLFLLLFMFSYVNSVLFSHTHNCGSYIVTHAHPYGNAEHGHSQQSFNFLSLVSCFSALLPEMQPDIPVFPAVLALVFFFRESDLLSCHAVHRKQRGPPSVFCFC